MVEEGFSSGSRIAGYRLERPLGQGGMGVVYRATQLALNRPVALKVIRPDVASQPDLARRFIREARVAANLEHPHVVPV